MGRVRPLYPERPGVALSRRGCRPLKATARPRTGGGGPPPAPDGRVVPVHRSSGTEWVNGLSVPSRPLIPGEVQEAFNIKPEGRFVGDLAAWG